MIRKIYHGSSRIVRSPGFGAGRAFNDFGLGFYCTEDIRIAREWACSSDSNGFVNKYRLETTGLRAIDLTGSQFSVLHWLGVLLNYREFDAPSSISYQARDYLRTVFGLDLQSYDCIIGWRADNSYYAFAQDFLDGKISYEQLRDLVTPGTLGTEYVIKSNRAFSRITFDGYETARSIDNYPLHAARERAAARDYLAITGHREHGIPAEAASYAADRSSGGLYIDQIIEEEVQPYDARLR